MALIKVQGKQRSAVYAAKWVAAGNVQNAAKWVSPGNVQNAAIALLPAMCRTLQSAEYAARRGQQAQQPGSYAAPQSGGGAMPEQGNAQGAFYGSTGHSPTSVGHGQNCTDLLVAA